uniref:Uncharacterized protein n=1 Tax=Zonotrichia albicollis TaxID=44394 RepID=A0A8D2NCF3_ZONAL
VSGQGLVARGWWPGAGGQGCAALLSQGCEAQGVQEAAVVLVEEETLQYQPTKNYLCYLLMHDYSAFETELMQNKIEHLAAPGTIQYEEV